MSKSPRPSLSALAASSRATLHRIAAHRRAVQLTAAACMLAAIGTVGAASAASATSAPATTTGATAAAATCSDATLSGTYLYSASGYQIYNGTPLPNAYAGTDHFNGDGTLSGIATYSSDGAISPKTTYTGTYTVFSDCSGTIFTSDGLSFSIYVAPAGGSFSSLQTSGQFVLSYTEKRVSKN